MSSSKSVELSAFVQWRKVRSLLRKLVGLPNICSGCLDDVETTTSGGLLRETEPNPEGLTPCDGHESRPFVLGNVFANWRSRAHAMRNARANDLNSAST
jgi:hypothetical protein